jgi:hypothetical protein
VPIKQLFENNREWARRTLDEEPAFFARLSAQQSPEVPVDRLFRQPGAGKRDRRVAAR